ncbi:carboxypeptidase regulatory-like domain-containing protein [Priestia megaterium]|uniref:carboxypeptidase regulatory-like domain-containing protein n=1 Tax=Priestia megaterium TaxID=1404 RepID=UPI0030006B4F
MFVVGTTIPVKSTLTDATGQYLVSGLEEGEYRVVISADNYGTQPFRIVLTPGEQEILNAGLTPNPATITGTVLDSATSTPLANALVQVFNSQGVFLASVLSDITRQYTLSGLPKGTLTVTASAADFGTGIQTVTLTAGQTHTVPFTLAPNPASLSGIVTNAQTGSPIAGALVQVFVVGTTIPVKSTLTDGTGQYLVSGLAEGEYRVVISADNYGTQPFRVVLTPGEQEILNAALTPNPATVSGRVVDVETGVPIANALIQAFTTGGTFVASTLTDVNG